MFSSCPQENFISRHPFRTIHHFSFIVLIVTALLVRPELISAQNIINTIAGGGSPAGPATGSNADIPGPSSVITDSQGNVYVASAPANQIYKISGGNISVFAGLGYAVEHPAEVNDNIPATSAYLNGPIGLAIDKTGNIYIADTAAYIIWKVNTSGVISQFAGDGEAKGNGTVGNCGPAVDAHLFSPSAVATDRVGNVYIADTDHNEIWLVNTQSTPIKGLCPPAGLQPGNIGIIVGTTAKLNMPQGLAVDSMGNVFISDAGNHVIWKLTPSGMLSIYAGMLGMSCAAGPCGDGGPATSAELGTPWQLYVDANDDLYFADSLEQRVRFITPPTQTQPAIINPFAGDSTACSGLYTPPITPTFCGDGGPATAAFLNRLEGVYGDGAGNIYIGDTGDQRVRVVSSGNINTFAGGGLGDGPALSAILASNQNIALDSARNLYIADTANNRIRKLSGGNISTIAGSGVANYYENNNALATNANLSAPYGIALDTSGNVYIADTDNYVIRVLNTQSEKIMVAGVTINPGELGTIAGKPQHACPQGSTCYMQGDSARNALLGLPKGIALDGSGNIYFADEAAAVISEVTTAGMIQTVAGVFWITCPNPTDPCGDLGFATQASLNLPYSVAVDNAGKIYISDAGDNRVRVVDPPPTSTINAYAFDGVTNFGVDGQPALSNAYIFPEYVALDARLNLFVSGSSLYYVVQRIDSSSGWDNLVASVAGYYLGIPKYFGFEGDTGPAVQSAQLNNSGVAIDAAEDLYISDGGNNRIREVTSSSTQGLVPVVKITPSTQMLDFGNVPVGGQSTKTFGVSNVGSDDLMLGTPTITNPPFSFVSANPCPDNLVPPDATCTFSVTFAPTQKGMQQQGQAVIYDNGFGRPSQTIMLVGNGTD